MRSRLGGEPACDLAREPGYADGSGMPRVTQRPEAAAAGNAALRKELDELREQVRMSIVDSAENGSKPYGAVPLSASASGLNGRPYGLFSRINCPELTP